MIGRLNKIRPMIEDAAARHGLNPALVGAVVMTESAAQPQACRFEPHVYHSGRHIFKPEEVKPGTSSLETEKAHQSTSWGLMQVMGFNARAAGYRGWLPGLCDPEVGLEEGCRHLAGCLERWPNTEDAVSSYNQGRPRRRSDGTYANQDYVDRVMRRYRRLEAAGRF